MIEQIKQNGHKTILIALSLLLLLGYALSVYWSFEPDLFEVQSDTGKVVRSDGEQFIPGLVTVDTTIKVASTLLHKSGGYLSNDIMPPSVFMDNIPSWEFGVLVQVRDMASALRNHMSRSQSQSLENKFLKKAEPLFNNDHAKWIFPAAENKYEEAIEQLQAYKEALAKESDPDNQFYARADNLRAWLELVEKRLGGLSQRLAASVGQERVNTDLAGDPTATQSTRTPSQLTVKTPWLKIDDNFYEARGACWALIHLLKAIQIDFAPVLEKKNASTSLAQIIRELEATQETVWSPMILNGSGFGFVANHSLVMANYISRANAGIIDLRELLAQG